MTVLNNWGELDNGPTATKRTDMIQRQLKGRGVSDERVLEAMGKLPRHFFVSNEALRRAYGDYPIEIGAGQTISQPFMVATMLELAELKGQERVLEVGTGSGYQTALLAMLADHVYSVERHAVLMESAETRLTDLGLTNVTTFIGDGSEGWFEHAPYDVIIVSAGSPEVPSILRNQLTDHGRLIIPVGDRERQQLTMVVRSDDSFVTTRHGYCLFVPLVGRGGWAMEE